VDRFEPNLRIPGPTGLPPSVREAGARQMINHRGPEFAAMLGRILDGMKPFFGTSNDVAVLTCAGSGGLEAAVVNTLSPGDRVLGVSIGSFGDRFAKIAGIYGADVTKLDAEWGYAAAPDEVRERLRAMPDVKAVLLTHNETSTGVMNPIGTLAAAIREERPEALILVDSVSGLGAVPFEMDAWGVDVVVTGSQKAWMAAPGLAMIAASERAWAAMETAKMPRFYLDLRSHRESAALGQTPFTPAIAVVYQVDEGLRLMHEEGKDNVFLRHEACAAASRAGLEALGFDLLADGSVASRTVTAVNLPEGHEWKPFNAAIKSHGVVLAGGQGKLTGKIFRLGHLGSVTVDEILGAIAVLERVSLEQGRRVEPGRAVAAAQAAALAVQTGAGQPAVAVPAGGSSSSSPSRPRGSRASGRFTRSTSGRESRGTSSSRSSRTTTRCSSAARSRSMPR
jgi:aspartate aminotransferase-like enzyme